MSDVLLSLKQSNPDFMDISKLADLGADEFAVRTLQRPAGYSSLTRVHVGRLAVPLLNDSGATCACVTEEQMVLLINHTTKMVEEGHSPSVEAV